MPEPLPTPLIEIFLISAFMGSVTYLVSIATLAYALKRKHFFKWTYFLITAVITLFLGNLCALWVWLRWSFSFDILYGSLFLPGIVPYTLLPALGYWLIAVYAFKSEK
ncbi:hypothetical protein N7E81_06420 [Reichenbachiella carrageenanivorans]|uniref:Uncharacterized protein n=1 Tax=Reichenbachiella carrageenanivorans TaxID=2979869 RepID=A0ABY6D3K4_9BACT|nr:hypothetical protein [Reichenbachiella carrageenanivorans]UXX80732.1 hypothetical protein N7E81_06420 [Reichenbachiella carrageenanivorans]